MVVTDWREEEVGNEVRSRDRNEWIMHTNDDFGPRNAADRYTCECGYGPCTDVMALTREEYEGVRLEPTHFAIFPDHENPESEFVLFENDRYAVVEKLSRIPRRIARDTDPRQ